MPGSIVGLLTVLCLLTPSSAASAGERLTMAEAWEATAKRIDKLDGPRDSWKVERCVRKSPRRFRCGTSGTWERASETLACIRTYRITSRNRIRTKLVDRGCRSEAPGNDLGPQTGPGPKFCPGDRRTWDARSDIEGRTVAEAIPIAEAHNCSIRVVEIDGEGQLITDDFSWHRLDVAVEGPAQKITRIVGVF